MTRINLIPPCELCDKHLLAEYRELPRIFHLARPCSDAPDKYVLGKGHVKFFYDKLAFLINRQRQIIDECLKRGFKIQHKEVNLVLGSDRIDLYNDYNPTQEAIALNRARIAERLSKMKTTKECWMFPLVE